MSYSRSGVWKAIYDLLRSHIALIQLTGVTLGLPPLIFPNWVPTWIIGAALAELILISVLGYVIARRAWVRTPLDWPIAITLLLLPVNLLISPDRSLTLPHVYKVLAGIALFYGVVGVLDRYRRFKLIAWGISIIGLVLAVIVLLGSERLVKFSQLSFFMSMPRLLIPFWNPLGFNANIAGGTLAMFLPVPTAILLSERRWGVRMLALIPVCGTGLVLLLTQSRSALFAIVFAFITMLITRNRRWLWFIVLVPGIVLLWTQWCQYIVRAGTWGCPKAQLDVHRLFDLGKDRFELWSRGWYMLRDFPLTGIGMGMVVRVMPLFYPPFSIPPSDELEHVHNLYLNTGAEMGFPGLIAQLAFLFGMLTLCVQAVRSTWRAHNTHEWAVLAWGMLGTVIVYCVHGITDHITFYSKAYLIAWALFGVAVGTGMAAWQTNHADTRIDAEKFKNEHSRPENE